MKNKKVAQNVKKTINSIFFQIHCWETLLLIFIQKINILGDFLTDLEQKVGFCGFSGFLKNGIY